MQNAYRQFGIIINSILGNHTLPDIEYDWDCLTELFKKQSITPILNYAVTHSDNITNQPSQNNKESLYKTNLQLVSRQVNQLRELDLLKKKFEENGIDCIFLKGSVIRSRYSNPLFRTMGDIDFLYKSEHHKLLKQVMLDNGYGGYEEGRKNDTYRKSKNIVVEAHRQLVPSDSCFYEWCNKVWDRSILSNGMNHIHEMKIEDEIIFSVIHMAIHFLEGGIGARFLCDIYVYKDIVCDRDYLNRELESIGLLEFYKEMSGLVDYWFSSETTEELFYDKMIDFIMDGGVFGTCENAQVLATEKGGFRYLMSYWFPSFREMCSLYPWLHGKAILLPLAWIKRAFTAVSGGKSVKASIKTAQKADPEREKEIRELYNDYGLHMTLR